MTWEKLILEQKAIPPVSDPGPSARMARQVLSHEQEGAGVESRQLHLGIKRKVWSKARALSPYSKFRVG